MFKIKLVVECDNGKTTMEKQLSTNDKWTPEYITNTNELMDICFGQFQRLAQKLLNNMRHEEFTECEP